MLCPPGRIYCLRGIPFGWSRVAPLAERRPHTGTENAPVSASTADGGVVIPQLPDRGNDSAQPFGARFSPNDVLYGEWSERWGREGARILLRSSPSVEAIFCGSDQIARGVSESLRLLGHRVPDDIALVGFDNWEPMVAGADPPLTSIDMCLEDVGRSAAEHLLSAINDEPTHGVHTVPCRLVIRGSTGPVATASPSASTGN